MVINCSKCITPAIRVLDTIHLTHFSLLAAHGSIPGAQKHNTQILLYSPPDNTEQKTVSTRGFIKKTWKHHFLDLRKWYSCNTNKVLMTRYISFILISDRLFVYNSLTVIITTLPCFIWDLVVVMMIDGRLLEEMLLLKRFESEGKRQQSDRRRRYGALCFHHLVHQDLLHLPVDPVVEVVKVPHGVLGPCD